MGRVAALERLPAGEARLNVVPPFDVVAFIGLPTQEDDPPVAHRGKIDQAMPVVLQLNSEGFEFARADRKIKKQLRVTSAARQTSAAMFGASGCVLCRGLKRNQSPVRTLDLPHDRTHVWEKGIRFFNRKQFH